MKILVLDNYDSFTYNLVQYIKEVTKHPVDVFRNDKISLADVATYDKIVLSPGPGIPREAGIMPELIKKYAATKSILGVCLGHQAIGEAFGARIFNMEQVYHGIQHQVLVEPQTRCIFEGIPSTFSAGRYHSWVVDEATLPQELRITCRTEDGTIMGIEHTKFDVYGLQYHPESVMTEYGRHMLANFLGESIEGLPINELEHKKQIKNASLVK